MIFYGERSGPGAARTIQLFHIISARPSKQPLMVRTFLKVYMELGSYFLFLQEQIKDIIISHYRRTKYGKIEGREPNRLWGWVDADFAADLDTRRSQHTGYVVMMNGGPVSWKSVKQKSVSLSTAESEWYAASEAGKELLYLRIIMREFGFPQLGPMHLYEDSRAVIAMAENPSNRKGARHIGTREHFVDQLVKDRIVKLVQCRCTDEELACTCF
jgi:hypothetical protein